MAKKVGDLLVEFIGQTAKLHKAFGEVQSGLTKLQKDFERVKQIAEVAFAFKAVELGLAGLNKLKNSVKELADLGEQAGSIEEAFKHMGGSGSSIEEARKRVVGLVDSFDLMQAANKGLLAGIPNFNNAFANIADLGGRVANALGVDTKQAINDLTDAIVKGQAKALKPLGFTFSDTKDKALVTKEAIAQLQTVMSKLPPVGDSAANAIKSLENTFGELEKQMGIQVNTNPELIKAFRNLEEVIKQLDVKQLADDIAYLATTCVNLLSEAIPVVTNFFHEFIVGAKTIAKIDWKTLITAGPGAALDAAEALQVKEMVIADKTKDILSKLSSGLDTAKVKGDVQKWGALVQELNNQAAHWGVDDSDPTRSKIGQLTKRWAELLTTLPEVAKKLNDTKVTLSAIDPEAKKLAETIKKDQEAWADFTRETEKKSVEDALKKATEALDTTAFNSALSKYGDALEAELKDKFKEGLANGAISDSDFSAFVARYNAQMIAPLTTEFNTKLKQAFDDAVKSLGDGLQGVLSAVDQIAGGIKQAFGVDIPKGMQKVLDITKGIFSIFQGIVSLVNSISQISSAISSIGSIGSALTGGVGGLGQGLGLAAGAGGLGGIIGSLGGGAGVMLADGSVVAAGSSLAAGGVASAALPGSGLLGAAAMVPGWGWALGGAALLGGLAFGTDMFGGKNADMDARRQVRDFLSQKTGQNFNIGAHDYFDPGKGGFNALNSLDPKGKNMFGGIGEGLRSLLGITQDIGPQIGSILAENLNGNLDKAKSLVKELGFSEEDMTNAVIKSGLQMGKTWLEIQGEIQGIQEAFTPGLTAFADLKGAIDEVTNSGGAGMDALQGLRDMAIEAGEGGAKSFAQFLQNVQSGMSPKNFQAFSQALQNYGIKSLDDLKNVSDKTAIAIIANMMALGYTFQTVADKVNDTTDAIKNMGQASSSVQGVTTNTSAVPKMASGGIVSNSTLALIGEAGPEAILPLESKGGRLGVRSFGGQGGNNAVHIHVDARGADAGVEHRIMAAMHDMEGRILKRSLNLIAESRRRGGNASFNTR